MNTARLVSLCILIIFLITSCKKDENPSSPNNPNPNNCNYTTDIVVVSGTSSNIVKVHSQAIGAGYIIEFLTDTSAAPTGVALSFNGSASPAAGDYTIEPDIANVTAGKVYVEYYDPATAWRGMSGTVKVTASGALKVITFCNQELVATATNKKTVSLHGTTN